MNIFQFYEHFLPIRQIGVGSFAKVEKLIKDFDLFNLFLKKKPLLNEGVFSKRFAPKRKFLCHQIV